MSGELQIGMAVITFAFVILYMVTKEKVLQFAFKYLFFVFAIVTTLSLSTLNLNEIYLVNLFEIEMGLLIVLLMIDFYKQTINFISLILTGKKRIKDDGAT